MDSYGSQIHQIAESLGGRYKHEGDTYTEILEYGTPALKDFLGNEVKFNVKLDGDKWHHTGELPGGFKIDEVWARLKQEKPKATAK